MLLVAPRSPLAAPLPGSRTGPVWASPRPTSVTDAPDRHRLRLRRWASRRNDLLPAARADVVDSLRLPRHRHGRRDDREKESPWPWTSLARPRVATPTNLASGRLNRWPAPSSHPGQRRWSRRPAHPPRRWRASGSAWWPRSLTGSWSGSWPPPSASCSASTSPRRPRSPATTPTSSSSPRQARSSWSGWPTSPTSTPPSPASRSATRSWGSGCWMPAPVGPCPMPGRSSGRS